MYCPKCGAQRTEGWKYCKNCGFKFDQESAVEAGAMPISQVAYAGFWRRFLAYILDGIILNIAGYVIGLIFLMAILSSDGNESTFSGISALVGFVIGVLYFTLFESSPKQATPGKMAMGIKVTDENGNRISLGRAIGRWFAKIISILIIFIGFIMIAFNAKKKGLHDMLAGTLVVLK